MSEACNNMAPRRGDSDVSQLYIMNQRMDQMTNEFGGRLDRLNRQYVNDYCRVQIRFKRK
jgi:hypothetical protein